MSAYQTGKGSEDQTCDEQKASLPNPEMTAKRGIRETKQLCSGETHFRKHQEGPAERSELKAAVPEVGAHGQSQQRSGHRGGPTKQMSRVKDSLSKRKGLQ